MNITLVNKIYNELLRNILNKQCHSQIFANDGKHDKYNAFAIEEDGSDDNEDNGNDNHGEESGHSGCNYAGGNEEGVGIIMIRHVISFYLTTS